MKESMNKEQERKRIGGKIAALRKARGMTQQQLADMAGLAQQNLARVETGRYSSRLDTLAAIAEALGCQVEFIIKDGE
jgi:transcriptional regulator with XRE-family HTH domain